MKWIFGSFLVTPCALTSCHVVICKQGSTISALGFNRCVTGRKPRNGNHAVRFRQSRELQSSKGHAADQVVSDELARGCKRWYPLAPGRSPLSEYMSLHLSPN